jgi:recombination protein RecT
VRIAQGALKKGKPYKDANNRLDPQGRTELEVAAQNNPAAFLSALLDAARQGLEPGTEQYYLTPRKVKGQPGDPRHPRLPGLHRADVPRRRRRSVVAEVVYGRSDTVPLPPQAGTSGRSTSIDWAPKTAAKSAAGLRLRGHEGRRHLPRHRAEPGAHRPDQGISRAGVGLGVLAVAEVEAAMWLKSAVRQLQKWVPTSAEYIREQLRAAADAHRQADTPAPQMPSVEVEPDYVDGEVVDVQHDEPAAPAANEPPITQAQLTKLHTLLSKCGSTTHEAKRDDVSVLVGHPVESTKDLTKAEAITVIDVLERAAADGNPAEALGQIIAQLAGGAE